MSGVTFENVTKRFGDVVAVDDLTLDIADQEFMVLLGPSGCGKSTALRMIAGLETVTDGTLRIGKSVVNDIEAKDRDIAMVFQSYALYPHMTVRQNVEVPLKTRPYAVDGGPRRKLDRAEREVRVTEAAEMLGLVELLDRKPAALSGGQRQRVALARALVRRPEAFLMDEPLSNLDAKLRAQTRVELVELHERLQTTIVYVTHDQIEAMTMADRVAILHEGRLQQVGTPREVYERPTNLFVARFVGSPPMNTVQGKIRMTDGATFVDVGTGSWPMRLPVGVRDADPVVVGVRPEHLRIGAGGVAATVRAVEWLGAERHVHCDLAGTPVVVRDAAPESGELRAGQPVELLTDLPHLHLFDGTTTERIG